LDPEKRVDLIVRLSALMGWSLIVVGAGTEADALQTLARRVAPGFVEFRGALAPSEIATLYASGGVHVTCSIVEGYPLACVEALACGIPAVALATTGLTQLTRYGLRLFDSLEQLAEKIPSLPAPDVELVRREHAVKTVGRQFWTEVQSAI
jgi:glycosyltransferase involved in cell wall biosynthesis